jgi:hypothetical protein
MRAVNGTDKQLAMLAWGGALLSGALAPGVVWGVSHGRGDSLALRQSRLATVIWLVALVAWIPTVVLGVFLPVAMGELHGRASEDWVPSMALVIVGIPVVVSVIGLIRAARSEVFAPPGARR